MSGRAGGEIEKNSLPFLCQLMGFHEKEVRQKWAAGPNEAEPLWNTYPKIARRQKGRERVIEVIYAHCIGAKK